MPRHITRHQKAVVKKVHKKRPVRKGKGKRDR